MQLSLTSQTGTILTLDSFTRVTLSTEDGVLTILPDHEPLLSALTAGIMEVHSLEADGSDRVQSFVTGGGVLHVHPDRVVVLADVVESEDSLSDLEYIATQKAEAARLVEMYKDQETIDPDRLIAIEKDLVKYSLMHELGMKYRDSQNARK